MEYHKISENLKYAFLRSKLLSIKTHPNTVNLHKLMKSLSTQVSDINLTFLAALSLESMFYQSINQVYFRIITNDTYRLLLNHNG